MDVGAFVLGVIFGWLVEWLYVTFFRGKGSDSLGDCSSYENELKTRNEEIKRLKASVSSNLSDTNSGVSLMSGSNRVTTKTNSALNKSTSNAASKATTVKKNKATSKAKSAVAKKSVNKKAVVASTGAVSKATKVATSNSKKSTAVNKSTTTKKSVVKKSSDSIEKIKPASVAKKIAPTKKVASKTVTKKKSAKKIVLKDNIKINNPSGDDLTKLSGIGPSMAATLYELGITSYSKLAAMDDDILRDMLEASGARLNNNKDAMDSWNEQATLAGKGDFEGLKKLQDILKK